MAVVMKSRVFSDITLRSPLKVSLCFGGTYSLNLHGSRVSQVRNQHEASSKQSFANSSTLFLQNVG
jgi:hypothetical protein